MPRRVVLNVALLVLAAIALGSGWLLGSDPSRPNVEYFPDMAHSPRYNAYAPNPNFADGQTLQTPVLGTIPRAERPLHYAATKEDAARAGDELISPLKPGDPAAAARGQVLFSNYCMHCHGATAMGDGPVAKRGFPPPPSLLAAHARQIKDGQIFHILTFGQGNMPAHAAQIPRDDRWYLVAYVRSLQAQNPLPPVPPTGAPANATPTKAAGGK